MNTDRPDDLEARLNAFGLRWRDTVEPYDGVEQMRLFVPPTPVPTSLGRPAPDRQLPAAQLPALATAEPESREHRRRARTIVLLAAAIAFLLVGSAAVVAIVRRPPLGADAQQTAAAPPPTADLTLAVCGDRVILPSTEPGGRLTIRMQRSGNSYAVSAAVTDPALAVPLLVFVELVIVDSQGLVVGMPTNESPIGKSPITLRQNTFNHLDTINLAAYVVPGAGSLFSSCTGDLLTPAPAGTYQVAAQVRLDGTIGRSGAVAVEFPKTGR